MNYILDHDGKSYRKFFEEISSIPRNSFQEEKISDYLVKFAKERGLWWYRDDIWNVIIKKPASQGYEEHMPVMLQGHTDMVCEKVPGSSHDFETDPLELILEDGWIKASGTTLGADCGDGVALMLAVLDDNTLKHPAIEAFFSVQEESGIGGPRFVDYSQFKAKRVIATDIIWEGTTYESVSGAVGGDFIKEVKRGKLFGAAFSLTVSKCTGGHSALNAEKCPANAIKAVARILYQIKDDASFRLISITGGSIRNNIPAECRAVFSFDPEKEAELSAAVNAAALAVKQEYSFTDPNMEIYLETEITMQESLTSDSSREVVELLHTLPTGEYMRSSKYGNAVFASRNMGNILINDSTLVVGYMFRGTIKSQTNDMMQQTLCLAGRFNAAYQEEYRYSGYISSKDSPLVNVWKEVYKEATGRDLYFLTMHGGTDVGTILDHLVDPGEIDVIAIGPNAKYVHTTNETLNLESFDRTYGYLTEILSRL